MTEHEDTSTGTELSKAEGGWLSGLLDLARPVVDEGCELLHSLLGKPFRVAGNLLGDQLYWWQWRNRLRIAARAQEILRERRVDPRVLPAGFLMPLLEGAGWADDPDVQELWARLIAGAATHKKAEHPIFIDVIRRMSGREARLFARMWSEMPPVPRPVTVGNLRLHQWTASREGLDETESVAYLEGMGLLQQVGTSAVGIIPESWPVVVFTAFALQFAQAIGLESMAPL